MKNALHLVCSERHFEGREDEVRKLIDTGWDVNARDEFGNTPLHQALKECLFEIAQIFIDAGADVNAANKIGDTPLLMAFAQPVEKLKSLVEAGANVNQCNHGRFTPLMMAAGGSWANCVHDEQVAFFIARGANVNAVNEWGRTALHYAAENQVGGDALKQLLVAKADPNARYGGRQAPLFYARTSIIAEALIRAGATVDADALQNPCVVKASARLLERQARAQRRILAKPPAAVRPRRRA